MAEIIKGPMTFDQSLVYLARLRDESQAFKGGSKPLLGRTRFNHGKVIGAQSFDNQVRFRFDYDPDKPREDGTVIPGKGYHINYENFNTNEKICILISDMTPSQYNRLIEGMTAGRSDIITPKMPVFAYSTIESIKDEKAYKSMDYLLRDIFPYSYKDRIRPLLFKLFYNIELNKIELDDVLSHRYSLDDYYKNTKERNIENERLLTSILDVSYYNTKNFNANIENSLSNDLEDNNKNLNDLFDDDDIELLNDNSSHLNR